MNEALQEILRNVRSVSAEALSSDITFFQEDNGYTPKDYRNILRIFEQDPALENALAFNRLNNRMVFMRNLPWRACDNTESGTEWSDADTLQFKRYAGDNYRLIFRTEIINEAIDIMARDKSFCPLQRYLDGLTWDGKPRIATALIDYLGAEDTIYSREVSSLLFRAMVARAYQAGCKYDHVVILQGGQGIGKSSFLRILGGDWYSDNIRKFDGKEAIEAINGIWLGEIAELQGFSKAGFEEIKAFITRTEDRARPAYGRRVESYPRRTVFVGTTNDSGYLRDATGNRRFFPIICTKKLDFAALIANREQLFAEALAIYQQDKSAPLILQNEQALSLAIEAQQAATYIDEWEDLIYAFLGQKIRDDYWDLSPFGEYPRRDGKSVTWLERDRVATRELLQECLGLSTDKITPTTGKRISSIMRRLNWEHGCYHFGNRYPKSRGYKKT